MQETANAGNAPANAGNSGYASSIAGLGRSPEVSNSNPLQYSCLKTSMGRGAWQATVFGVTKTRTRLNAHTHAYTGLLPDYF